MTDKPKSLKESVEAADAMRERQIKLYGRPPREAYADFPEKVEYIAKWRAAQKAKTEAA